jgi:hypothetical protein
VPTHKADNLTAICEPNVQKKYGSLDVSQPYGSSRPVTGIVLPLIITKNFERIQKNNYDFYVSIFTIYNKHVQHSTLACCVAINLCSTITISCMENWKRPSWSRGNVPTSWPEWRGFKLDGGRRTSPPGGTLSRLTRVVDLLHVKEPHVPRGPLSKNWGHFPSKYIVVNSSARVMVPPFSGRWGERCHHGERVWRLILNSQGTYNRPHRSRSAWGNPPLNIHTYIHTLEKETRTK